MRHPSLTGLLLAAAMGFSPAVAVPAAAQPNKEAYALYNRFVTAMERCWFGPNATDFAQYVYSPEPNAATGPRILVVAPSTTPAHIDEEPVDVLILSPRNPHVPEIIAKATPGVVLFDEAFLCQSLPDVPRVNLETFHTIQKALQPQPSVLLAPGESWDVARH